MKDETMNEKDWTGESGEFKHLTIKQRRDMKQQLLRASIYGSVTSVLERAETLSRLRVESTIADLKQKSLDLLKDLDECEYHKVTYDRLADLRSLVGDLESPTSTIIDCKKSLKEILERLSKDYASLKEWSAPSSPPKKATQSTVSGPLWVGSLPSDSDGGDEVKLSTPAKTAKPVIEYVDKASPGNSYYSRPVGDQPTLSIKDNVDCPCQVGLGCESWPPHTPQKGSSQKKTQASDQKITETSEEQDDPGDHEEKVSAEVVIAPEPHVASTCGEKEDAGISKPPYVKVPGTIKRVADAASLTEIPENVPREHSASDLGEDTRPEAQKTHEKVRSAAIAAAMDVADSLSDRIEPLIDFRYQEPFVMSYEEVEEAVKEPIPYKSAPGLLKKVAENVQPGEMPASPHDSRPLKEAPVGLEEVGKKPVETPYITKPGFINRVASKVEGLNTEGDWPEKEFPPDSRVKKIIENLEKRETFREDNFGIPPQD
jgi:hypothetical protein